MDKGGRQHERVRLHVGGLPRGITSDELASLVARALPSDVNPIAEIMRDSTTGIERGFAYVNIPEGGPPAAERVIGAYNGTRWRGGKIRVGMAKGDYIERLKGEWREAQELRQRSDDALLRATERADYKARPALRIRRRSGDRVILVDPTPIPWVQAGSAARKRSRPASGATEGAANEHTSGDAESERVHKRKRGIWGCRQKLDFSEIKTSMSTSCRQLWRKHLQRRTTEASAAQRNSVERMMARRSLDQIGHGPQTISDEEDDKAAQLVPVGDAMDFEPERSQKEEGIEFLWDDSNHEDDSDDDDGGDGADADEAPASTEGRDDTKDHTRTVMKTHVGRIESEHYPDQGSGRVEDNFTPNAETETSAVLDEKSQSRDEVKREDGSEEAFLTGSRNEEGKKTARREGMPRERREPDRVQTEDDGRRSKGHRSRFPPGLEIDDRMMTLLSDGEGDEADDVKDYDYELETTKMLDSTAIPQGATGRETAKIMAEKLESETQRSLSILNELLGVEHRGHRAANIVPSTTVRFDPTRPRDTSCIPQPEGRKSDQPRDSETISRGPTTGDLGGQENRSGDPADRGEVVEGHTSGPGIDSNVAHERYAACGLESKGSMPKDAPDPAVRCSTPASGPSGERFVAHMSSLTEIFKVEDKVSTKKNEREKDKDKSFRMSSLFGAALSQPATVTANPSGSHVTRPSRMEDASPGEATFKFSFGDDAGNEAAEGERTAEGSRINAQDSLHPGTSTVALSGHGGEQDSHALEATLVEDETEASRASQALGMGQMDDEKREDTCIWRPMSDAVAAKFMRAGRREDVEATWLQERKSLTKDFKRKHKDAVKARQAGGRGATGMKPRRGARRS